ncbi:MAG: DNA replication complex GINS family protein [Euryarchaeota archaeon]|nr:DNA replication complex GINS family protein [Euryarchaeota archaeon]
MEKVIEYGEVSAVYRREKDGKALAEIADDFFEQINRCVSDLRAQAGDAQRSPQDAHKSTMLLNDAKKLETMAHHIKDARERKIALLAQSGADPGTLPLTAHEKALFGGIVNLLESHRALLDGRAHAEHEPCPAPQVKLAEAAPKKADLLVIQVLEDVREFATEERTYALKKSDVVALPREYGAALLRSGKAREIAPAP